MDQGNATDEVDRSNSTNEIIETEEEDEDSVDFADALADQQNDQDEQDEEDEQDESLGTVLYKEQPSLHSYLGSELEIVRGRTVFEDGAIITLDLLQPADLVLMPGQTLPLTVFDDPTINMLRNCIRNDRTFGVLASWTDGHNTTVNNIGTTVEIYEYCPQEGSSGFRVKAKARQRFKLLEPQTNRWKAKVRILPEVRLTDPLEGVKLQSLNKYRSTPEGRQRCRKLDAAVTRWPAFVYEQYDIKRLMDEITQEVETSIAGRREGALVMIPTDPTDMSFWVAQNMPMKEEHRLLLLKLNSPIQRLRWELKALQQCRQILYCQFCMNFVGSFDSFFSMTAEGPQTTFVNPGGFLHETITLFKVKNIFSVGLPSTEFSWFPGYAWTICKCRHCNQHMGWEFTATKSSLRPEKFWGISRRSVSVKTLPYRAQKDEKYFAIF